MEQNKIVMKCKELMHDFTPKVEYDICAPALKYFLASSMVTFKRIVTYLPCAADCVTASFIEAATRHRAEAQKMINE